MKWQPPYSNQAVNDIIDVDYKGDFFIAVHEISSDDIENKNLANLWQQTRDAFGKCEDLIEEIEKILTE